MKRKIILGLVCATLIATSLTACGSASKTVNNTKTESVSKKDKSDVKSEDVLNKEHSNAEDKLNLQDAKDKYETEDEIKTEKDVVDHESNEKVYDDSLPVEDIANMSLEEFEAYEVEFRAQSDANWQAYEDAKNAPTERDNNGKISMSLFNDKLTFMYGGDTDVQMISQAGKDFVLLTGLDDVSSVGIGVYSGDDYADSLAKVVGCNHVNADDNGEIYYTASSTTDTVYYMAFTCFDEPTIGVITIKGNINIDDISVLIKK